MKENSRQVIIRLKNQAISLFMMVLFIGLCFSADASAADGSAVPTVTKAQLINSRDIEIYWSEDVTGAGWIESRYVNNKLIKQEQNFSVTVDGVQKDIDYWCFEEYNNYENKGIVYYNGRNEYYPDNPDTHKTSIRLAEPIANLKNLPEIKVIVKGNKIKGKSSGNYVPEQAVSVDNYEPFYQKERTLDCGIKVLGTGKVRDEAMDKAKEMLEIILKNEAVAKRMGDAGCMLGIYGEGEIAYDIPEHRFEYDEQYLYVEGFGGTQLASIRDANVLRLRTENYSTSYPDESILTHEFAHTIYNFGLSESQQAEFLDIFNRSRAAGRWENSYAGSNKDEFFATLSAMWFNAMDDTWDGKWDGVRGPINTREELRAYDKEAYDFMSKIYVSDQYLPSPWENGTVPDNYTYKSADTKPGDEEKPGDETKPGNDTKVKEYIVTFVYNNGVKDINNVIKEKEILSEPPEPKRKNYIFKGWYLGDKKYSFDSEVTGNVTLQAKWEKVIVDKTSVKSLKAKKGKKVSVTIKKLKNVKGYKITYARDKKLKKSKKTVYTISWKKTLTKLKKGTYYVGVQAYQTDSTGQKVFGKMSKAKKVEVKK